jgi:hypothetical protein
MTDTQLGASEKDDPTDVARDGFEGSWWERNGSSRRRAKVQGRAGGLVPDNVRLKMHRAQAEPGSRR